MEDITNQFTNLSDPFPESVNPEADNVIQAESVILEPESVNPEADNVIQAESVILEPDNIMQESNNTISDQSEIIVIPGMDNLIPDDVVLDDTITISTDHSSRISDITNIMMVSNLTSSNTDSDDYNNINMKNVNLDNYFNSMLPETKSDNLQINISLNDNIDPESMATIQSTQISSHINIIDTDNLIIETSLNDTILPDTTDPNILDKLSESTESTESTESIESDNSSLEESIPAIPAIPAIPIEITTSDLDSTIKSDSIIKKITNIPIPEIARLVKESTETIIEEPIPPAHHVIFSTSDSNNIRIIPDNSTTNLNANSTISGSEFSYTKAIKSTKAPRLFNTTTNKIIKAAKLKLKKKIVDLDEVDYLHNKLQDYVRNIIINRSNYCILVVKAMELIENYEEMDVQNKKETVEKAIQRLLMIDLEINDFDHRLILASLSNLIDLIIICTRTKSHNNEKRNFTDTNQKIDDIILANNGQIVHSLIDKLTTIILKKQYTAERLFVNMATITEILMMLADRFEYLTGCEKKMIVIEAIDLFIRKRLQYIIEITDEKHKEIITALDLVPNTIDLFIALQKGRYKINKKQIAATLKVRKASIVKKIFCLGC